MVTGSNCQKHDSFGKIRILEWQLSLANNLNRMSSIERSRWSVRRSDCLEPG